MTHETFFAKIRDSGSNTSEITIPSEVMKILGLKIGDRCKFWITQEKEPKPII